MAYVVDQVIGASEGSSTTSPEWRSWFTDQQSGDYVIVCAAIGDSGGFTYPGTWTRIGSAPNNLGGMIADFLWIKHTGTDIPEPAFVGASDPWAMTAILIRDAEPNTADFINAFTVYESPSSTTNETFQSVTTTEDNCLILYLGASRNNTVIQDNWFGDMINLQSVSDSETGSNASVSIIAGYNLQGTAGATPSVTTQQISANRSRFATICIKNATGGAISAGVVPLSTNPITEVYNAISTSPTLLDINSIRTTFNGNSTYAYASITNSNRTSVKTDYPRSMSPLREHRITTSGTPGWHGYYTSVTGDFSTESLIVLMSGFADGNLDSLEGTCFYFEDSVGNWALYSAINKFNREYQCVLADLTQEAMLDSGGTIDWSDVIRFGVAWRRLTASSTFRQIRLSLVGAIDFSQRHTMIGGNAANPLTLREIANLTFCSALGPMAQTLGSNSNMLSYGVDIGDGGTNPTYFRASGQNLLIPASGELGTIRLSAGNISYNINIGASDTCDLSGIPFVASSGAPQQLTFDPATSTSGTYVTSAVTDYFDWTCKTGVPIVGAQVSNAAPIDAKGAEWNNCTISSTRAGSSEAAIKYDTDSSMDGTTIDVTDTSAGYHLELGTAVTAFTLTDVTFTGTPGTDKIHVLRTTGTVTITVEGSTTLVEADVTSEGATIQISAPSLAVQTSGYTANSRVYIYNEDTAQVLYNDKVVGSTFDFVYTEGGDLTTGDTILVLTAFTNATNSYYGIGRSIATAEGVNVLISEEEFTDYAVKGIDGSLETEYSLNENILQMYINAPDNGWDIRNLSAWYRWELFDSAEAIANFFNILTTTNGIDYVFDSDKGDILLENLRDILAIEQSRYSLRRKDGARPYKTIAQGALGDVEVYWQEEAIIAGSGLEQTLELAKRIDARTYNINKSFS